MKGEVVARKYPEQKKRTDKYECSGTNNQEWTRK
jgi:hypothetical protein